MERTKFDYLQESERSEEVQHIIERMPSKFGIWITIIVVFLFLLMAIFGWLVRYLDVVTGQININGKSIPLRLVANANGRLKINAIKSMDPVRKGQVLAYIENPANPKSVMYIDSLLKLFNPNRDDILKVKAILPRNISLGELNVQYYSFANSLQDYYNYQEDKMIDNQAANYSTLLKEQNNAINTAVSRLGMAKNSLIYVYKFYKRDSTLYSKKIISESELDKTQMNYISSKDKLEDAVNNLINARQAAQQTRSKIQELGIQNPEKRKELQIALISTYNDLIDNIKSWEQRYVFKALFDGKVQFLKFYHENQFVQVGEQVFAIVPEADNVFGEVFLPAHGSGKIKNGQEVIVKLDNYPYMEYGSIKGRIKSISLTTNTTKTDKSDIETYMILVDFPYQLKTNYGVKLDFKADAKGSVEIITNDRRIIERLFDNLKYILKK
jgi:multidrug resistance efflux pump